jgi:hypothetical protein
VAFHLKMQSWVGDDDAAYLGQPLTRSRKQFKAAGLKENVRHAGDQAAGCVACGKNGI